MAGLLSKACVTWRLPSHSSARHFCPFSHQETPLKRLLPLAVLPLPTAAAFAAVVIFGGCLTSAAVCCLTPITSLSWRLPLGSLQKQVQSQGLGLHRQLHRVKAAPTIGQLGADPPPCQRRAIRSLQPANTIC